jgi:hypothetical protein
VRDDNGEQRLTENDRRWQQPPDSNTQFLNPSRFIQKHAKIPHQIYIKKTPRPGELA